MTPEKILSPPEDLGFCKRGHEKKIHYNFEKNKNFCKKCKYDAQIKKRRQKRSDGCEYF